jgi:DnaJ-class molecular chaperone
MARNAGLNDFYDVLGVPRDADTKAIQKAFHDLARQSHPDVTDDPASEDYFRELSHAYEVLSNRQARLLYDRLAYRGPGGGGFGPVHPGVGRPSRDTEHISDYELLSWIFGDDAPAQPPFAVEDDPLVLALAAAGFVTSLVVLLVVLLN